jgi:hypothetical protein
MYEDLDAP